MFRVLAFLICVGAATPGFAQKGFVDLFNGKDLTGWDGDPELWSVEDGAITGKTNGPDHLEYNKFLIWTGGTLKNFQLRAKFRLEGDNNSGIQYRSQHLKDAGDRVVGGYQADIHAKPEYLGMLYDERGRGIVAQRGQQVLLKNNGEKEVTKLDVPVEPVDLTEWHELTITARGNRLVHKLDGVVTVRISDRQRKERESEGILALQVHRGPAMKVQFKDIKLKTYAPRDQQNNDNESESKPADPKPEQEASLREPSATPVEGLKVAKGFQVELLYSVPKDQEGSWVNMCTDPQGRLIVSDQYGGLFRVTPPPVGKSGDLKIEKIPVDIGEAQGLLWAFDSLYVVVNKGEKYESGLYRVRDTDGDDVLDSLETLRLLDGRGEHGPHAVLLTPDKKSLYIVCGDGTKMTELDSSRVPQVWDEDLLLPRTYGRGFMKGVPAPGGYLCKIDPDGKTWELVSTGFRNQFDAALSADNELFTFDADMEWDMNTPWYRPTRVCHVVSGSEFGWRNGAGKWPVYYPDSLPPVVDIGPGSPTGICFGYGAKFPAKYQKALFVSDWSYGKLYAVHMQPDGSTFRGTAEEFITGTPLPLTDVIVNPHDQAMYFAIGGRRVQSGLYRVTYTGAESTAPADLKTADGADVRKIRKRLEALHVGDHPQAIEKAWPYLKHPDRFVRFAARIAIEKQDVNEWRDRALSEGNPTASLTALLGLARQSKRHYQPEDEELDTPVPDWTAEMEISEERAALRDRILDSLSRLRWEDLSVEQRIGLLRVITLTFQRIAPPDAETRQKIISHADYIFPAQEAEINSELAQLMVYLQAPSAARKIVDLLKAAPTQESQIDYAKTLRHLRVGWTPALRETYFRWFGKAAGYRGGASFGLFVQHIKEDALALLTEQEVAALKPILEAQPTESSATVVAEPRPFVKKWTMAELVPLVETKLKGRDFDHGRAMFAAANCFACHRFDNQGGAIGPDLTALSGRFSPRDILESVADPNKVISDQYAAVTIVTIDGKVITGRIVNLSGDTFKVNTNMLDPNAQATVDRKEIDEMLPSKVSMMPADLLNSLHEEEILDLMAYLLSRGDRNHPMFAK